MKVHIELDSVADADVLARIFGSVQLETAKKPRKPTEPVKGNPDEPAPLQSAERKAAPVAQQAPAQSDAPATITLRADAPEQIVRLQKGPVTKEVLGDAILKCAKPVEEGGRTRAVLVGILEKFRPEGYTDPLVKVGVIPAEKYPEVANLILAEYKA